LWSEVVKSSKIYRLMLAHGEKMYDSIKEMCQWVEASKMEIQASLIKSGPPSNHITNSGHCLNALVQGTQFTVTDTADKLDTSFV